MPDIVHQYYITVQNIDHNKIAKHIIHPSGRLFAGSEGIKSAAEAAVWGGFAGQQYDPCYHLAGDTFANTNDFALDVNSDTVAYAVLQYAMNTEDINGVRGKGNFQITPGFSDPQQQHESAE